MIKDKISSQEIIDLVAVKASVSKRAAEEFLKVMIASIEDALLAGESVKIKNFGTFKLQWNEPRKSVNIQSGDEILLAGYHKVTFTPDSVLRDLVNEPFAHLEPVELDGGEETADLQQDETSDVALDPLRIFTEQAFEIKNILSEIQALSANAKQEEPKPIVEDVVDDTEDFEDEDDEELEPETPTRVEIPDYVFGGSDADDDEPVEISIAKEKEPTTEEQKIILSVSRGNVKISEVVEPQKVVTKEPFESEPVEMEPVIPGNKVVAAEVSDESVQFSEEDEPERKIKTWMVIAFIVLLVVGGYVGLYSVSLTVKDYTDTLFETVSGWINPKPVPAPKPVVVPIAPVDSMVADSDLVVEKKDTVGAKPVPKPKVKVKESVDSLQLLFDNPRDYEEFIASEQIKDGSRLTVMSLKYYGTKDFWVYIYEANKERIPNPDNIAIGTLIRIPKLDPRLIDASNPRCMAKAKELHDKYVIRKK